MSTARIVSASCDHCIFGPGYPKGAYNWRVVFSFFSSHRRDAAAGPPLPPKKNNPLWVFSFTAVYIFRGFIRGPLPPRSRNCSSSYTYPTRHSRMARLSALKLFGFWGYFIAAMVTTGVSATAEGDVPCGTCSCMTDMGFSGYACPSPPQPSPPPTAPVLTWYLSDEFGDNCKKKCESERRTCIETAWPTTSAAFDAILAQTNPPGTTCSTINVGGYNGNPVISSSKACYWSGSGNRCDIALVSTYQAFCPCQ